MTPDYVSPVLKQNLVIQLASTFSKTLTEDGVTVKIIDNDASNPTNIKELNVVSVDDSAKSITVKYGGAYSGEYSIEVTVSDGDHGRVDASALTL